MRYSSRMLRLRVKDLRKTGTRMISKIKSYYYKFCWLDFFHWKKKNVSRETSAGSALGGSVQWKFTNKLCTHRKITGRHTHSGEVACIQVAWWALVLQVKIKIVHWFAWKKCVECLLWRESNEKCENECRCRRRQLSFAYERVQRPKFGPEFALDFIQKKTTTTIIRPSRVFKLNIDWETSFGSRCAIHFGSFFVIKCLRGASCIWPCQ